MARCTALWLVESTKWVVGSPVSRCCPCSAAGKVASSAASVAGVTKVLVAEGAQLDNGLAENIAATVVDVTKANKFTHVYAPASGFGKNIIPRVAALLDVNALSEIMAVKDESTFVRPMYAGNAIATVTSSDAIKVRQPCVVALLPVWLMMCSGVRIGGHLLCSDSFVLRPSLSRLCVTFLDDAVSVFCCRYLLLLLLLLLLLACAWCLCCFQVLSKFASIAPVRCAGRHGAHDVV